MIKNVTKAVAGSRWQKADPDEELVDRFGSDMNRGSNEVAAEVRQVPFGETSEAGLKKEPETKNHDL